MKQPQKKNRKYLRFTGFVLGHLKSQNGGFDSGGGGERDECQWTKGSFEGEIISNFPESITNLLLLVATALLAVSSRGLYRERGFVRCLFMESWSNRAKDQRDWGEAIHGGGMGLVGAIA